MKFLASASLVSLAVTALAQDSVGASGDDLGRCHVYNVGDYGACGVQATKKDVDGPCGDSPSNPCITTSNANQCPASNSKCNCGVCYKLTMKYTDGHVTTAYVVSQDTNGSETRYEMSQQAWQLLCPYGCQGTGVCAYKEAACEYGILPDPGFPASCQVQYNDIHWEAIACGGSPGPNPNPNPNPQPNPQPTQSPNPQPTQSPNPHPTQAPYYPTQAPYYPTQAPYYPTQAPYYPTQAPYHPTQAPYYPTQAPYYPTQAPYYPTQAPYYPTQAPYYPTQAPYPPPPSPYGPDPYADPEGYCVATISPKCTQYCHSYLYPQPKCTGAGSNGVTLVNCILHHQSC